MNKLNLIPEFKEVRVGGLAKEFEKVVKEPITKVNDKKAAEEVAKIAEKVPADAYKGFYAPYVEEVKPYTQGLPKDITPEQLERAKSPEYIKHLIEGK